MESGALGLKGALHVGLFALESRIDEATKRRTRRPKDARQVPAYPLRCIQATVSCCYVGFFEGPIWWLSNGWLSN